jgi:thiol-disulfide isomerase/thioredoxin
LHGNNGSRILLRTSVCSERFFLQGAFMIRFLSSSLRVVLFTTFSVAASLQIPLPEAQAQDTQLTLPEDSALWINSRPITSNALKGKAAVLWFFEEDCPTCKGKWPNLIAISKKFEGKPVIFIGVNSGKPRAEIESYAKEVGLKWPILLDPTREFEKAAGIGEISLQNIHQLAIIGPDGKFSQANWAQFEATAEQAAASGKWTVDPAGIPPALMPAWSAIEMGDFSSAATLVKKGLATSKPEIKDAATKLNDAVQVIVTQELELAKKALAGDQKWQAYKLYQSINQRFAGYSLPEDVAAQAKELAKEDLVKQEIAAAKILDTVKRGLRTGTANARRTANVRLKKLIEDSSDTEAAKEAQTILAEIGG